MRPKYLSTDWCPPLGSIEESNTCANGIAIPAEAGNKNGTPMKSVDSAMDSLEVHTKIFEFPTINNICQNRTHHPMANDSVMAQSVRHSR